VSKMPLAATIADEKKKAWLKLHTKPRVTSPAKSGANGQGQKGWEKHGTKMLEKAKRFRVSGKRSEERVGATKKIKGQVRGSKASRVNEPSR